jgi:hypothetical protein
LEEDAKLVAPEPVARKVPGPRGTKKLRTATALPTVYWEPVIVHVSPSDDDAVEALGPEPVATHCEFVQTMEFTVVRGTTTEVHV